MEVNDLKSLKKREREKKQTYTYFLIKILNIKYTIKIGSDPVLDMKLILR